ncbi:MAG: hypothetical protein IAG10_33285, partial [Planctomycetaceae bacterium]|nr:hypothetical protein [Planctomycetaceae bacterium]
MKDATGWLSLLVILNCLGAESVPAEMTDADRAAAYANLSPVSERYVLNDDS